MANEDYLNEILESFLEDILFEKEKLNALKDKIDQIEDKRITKEELWKSFIAHKATILATLLKKLPSVLNICFPKNEKESPSNQEEITQLQNKLQEREALLELAAQKIQKIYSQL